MNKDEEILKKIRNINKQILRNFETEIEILKEEYPSLIKSLDATFKRTRQHVLDTVGDCERGIVALLEDG